MSTKGKEHERREQRRDLNYRVAQEIFDAVRATKEFSRVSGPNRERANDEYSLSWFIAFEGYELDRYTGATRPVFYSITVKDIGRPSGIAVRRVPITTAEQRAKVEALEKTAEEIRASHAKQKRRRT